MDFRSLCSDAPRKSAILFAMSRIDVFCAAALAAGLASPSRSRCWPTMRLHRLPPVAWCPAASRIAMVKEVLQISPAKVVVDYGFRNDTDQNVTTEVAFPVPPYANEFAEEDISEQSFQSFKLWVDGKPVHLR